MLKIVVAHPHFMYPGGASIAVLETADRLARAGDELHIVSLGRLPELTTPFTRLHFHDLGGPLSGDLRYWLTLGTVQRRFHRVVDAVAPDALLASVFPANYWAFVYRARRPHIPCIWYCPEPSAFVHDWEVIRGVPWPMRAGVIAINPALQVLDRWLVRYADAILVNSAYTAGRVRQVYHRAATPVHPGVNAARFAPDTPKERLVLAVARLTRFKRIDILIRAAARLRQRGYDDVRWVVAGDGEARPALRALAVELGVDDLVLFAGRLSSDALVDYFNRALIVAVTAIGEPFGLVPLEAMAAGAAVVCSDSGGPVETVQHGVTGLHFRSGDVDDFAHKVATLLDNPQQAREMGARGRGHVVEVYTWERTAQQIRSALQRVSTE